MRAVLVVVLLLSSTLAPPAGAAEGAGVLARRFADEVQGLNEEHLRKPGATREPELAARVSKRALAAVDALVALDDEPAVREALVTAAEAALDIDRLDVFDRVRARLVELDPQRAREVGVAVSRERAIVRGTDGLSTEYVAHFADVLDAVLDQYAATFGFAEWSKVPGKKLRVRVHLVERITRPPHFAPQHPFHSEIDFPVAGPERFTSPTPDGKFLFYGLCHELGHVIAMWGDRKHEEDHHAWAHYTGVVVVEAMARARRRPRWMDDLRDDRWRSLSAERERLENEERAPSRDDRDGVLALLIALHDEVGPEAIGAAINHLDARDERLRIHQVRYTKFDQLRDALLATLKDPAARKTVRRLLE